MKDKDKESYVPQHWFQKSDLDMKRSEIALYFLKEIKILLSAHANRTHVILYNIDVNFFVFAVRLAPGQVKTWCEPTLRLCRHPNSSKIFSCVFQSVGEIFGITLL